MTVDANGNGNFNIFGPEGGPFPEGSRTYNVFNNGHETIEWIVEASEPWLLTASENDGTLESHERTQVTISIDQQVAAALPPGEYPSEIAFRDAAGDVEVLRAFQLTVVASSDPGDISVGPDEPFTPTGDVAGSYLPASKRYTVTNRGDSLVSIEATSDQPWIRVNPGTADLDRAESVDVVVSLEIPMVDALDPGTYNATISFKNLTNGMGDTEREVLLTINDPGTTNGRVTEGLIALYTFEEGDGNQVLDVSGIAPAMDLQINDTNAAQWVPGSLSLQSATIVESTQSASKLIAACQDTNEITIEAWIRPSNVSQDGPARIVTVSNGNAERNFTLGQGLWGSNPSDLFDVRLRTTGTDDSGIPSVTTDPGTARVDLMHVVYTRRADGRARVYIDGDIKADETVSGSFANWNGDFKLAFGNEIGGSRAWLGELHLVALYDQALTSAEVNQNLGQGSGDVEFAHLSVVPGSAFTITGEEGGPFTPASKSYTLTNAGSETMQWSASVSESWMEIVGAQSGSLAAGQSTDVNIRIKEGMVEGFDSSVYTGEIEFSNDSGGYGSTSREARLSITSPGSSGETIYTSTVTQHGITWTFDANHLVGQFVNGDYWVMGPVTVTSVSPGWTGSKHGSMVNPQTGHNSGYDTNIVGYSASKRATYPLTLQPGQSLASVHSHTGSGTGTDVTGRSFPMDIYHPLKTMAVLTAVDAQPPATAFRPPYIGDEKPIYDSAFLRRDLLPELAATGGSYYVSSSGPITEMYARIFQRPWILHVTDWKGYRTHATDNMPSYHQYVYNVVSDAAVVLISDLPNKEELLINFVQVGIDNYYATKNGVQNGLTADSSVHKWLSIFAGTMLDVHEMKTTNGVHRTDWMAYYPNQGSSSHDSNIVPQGQGWTGATVLWRQDPGNMEHEHMHVSEWGQLPNGGGGKRESYRRINSHPWPGAQLAALSVGARDNWNHPAFFDYVDRWMTRDESEYDDQLWFPLYWGTGDASSSFVRNMWFTHRDQF